MVERQLALFEQEHAELIRECERAEPAYADADRDEAEERYGDYVDLLATGTDELARMRDTFAATLSAGEDTRYEA